MMEWSLTAQRLGLTAHETIVLGAQFTGLAAGGSVPMADLDSLSATLELAQSAMNTAAVSLIEKKLRDTKPGR